MVRGQWSCSQSPLLSPRPSTITAISLRHLLSFGLFLQSNCWSVSPAMPLCLNLLMFYKHSLRVSSAAKYFFVRTALSTDAYPPIYGGIVCCRYAAVPCRPPRFHRFWTISPREPPDAARPGNIFHLFKISSNNRRYPVKLLVLQNGNTPGYHENKAH